MRQYPPKPDNKTMMRGTGACDKRQFVSYLRLVFDFKKAQFVLKMHKQFS